MSIWETIFGTSKCRVHDCKLITGAAVVKFGRVVLGDKYLAARKKLFPHSMLFVSGGCLVKSFDQLEETEETLVDYCPFCREAERDWVTANPEKLEASEIGILQSIGLNITKSEV